MDYRIQGTKRRCRCQRERRMGRRGWTNSPSNEEHKQPNMMIIIITLSFIFKTTTITVIAAAAFTTLIHLTWTTPTNTTDSVKTHSPTPIHAFFSSILFLYFSALHFTLSSLSFPSPPSFIYTKKKWKGDVLFYLN